MENLKNLIEEIELLQKVESKIQKDLFKVILSPNWQTQ